MSGGTARSGNGAENDTDQTTQPVVPRVQVVGQYIKDLSFENPAAPTNIAVRPQIDLGVDVQARRMDGDHYEVELKLRLSATSENRAVFLLELAYAGLFLLQNVPDDVLQPILLIEAPHILFPFARRIVSDVVRDGGMPPLMIDLIDFAALYQAKAGQMQQVRAGTPPPTVS